LTRKESVQLTFLRHFRDLRLLRDEQGIVLIVVLIVMVLLLGMGLTSLFSGYTNLLTSTNLKLATQARNTTEAGINEAMYRLSRQEGQPGAITPNLNDPNWQVQVLPTGTPTSSTQVASIQPASDWGDYAHDTPPVTLRYKKDASGNVIFYNRSIPAPNPPFLTLALPPPVGALVSTACHILCNIGVGGILGLCPGTVDLPDVGYPVIQITATGLDERGAERVILAEAVRTLAFSPPASLSSGVDVNLGGSSFIDGVNHDHRIQIAAGNIYGDNNTETTDAATLLNLIKDSPDDTSPLPLLNHGIANPTLLLPPYLYPIFDSPPRLFNKQISATDLTPAWVGVTRLLSGAGGLWKEQNQGYASAIALKNGPTVTNDHSPTSGVWTRGVFTWRKNNQSGLGAIPGYPSSCSPSGTPTLVCRPAQLTPFPTLQEYLGLDTLSFQSLLDHADTTRADLNAGQPPLGFTYVQGNYTYNNSTASPGTNDFGLLYVTGDLTINGNQTFKGLIFVDGSLSVSGTPIILGAIMVRGSTNVTASTGNMTLLYSRKAADLGIQTAHPWRMLSWEDTAIQGSTYTE
jgi:hypothetical protein